jgi:uncharacterized membrane protein
MRSAALFLVFALAACGSKGTEPTDVAPSTPPTEKARFSTSPPPKDPDLVIRYKARGNEPFWAVDVEGKWLTYSDPETAGITIETQRSDMTWTGTYEGKPLQFRIERRTCSDGMSDKVYDFAADLKLGDRMLVGCAIFG